MLLKFVIIWGIVLIALVIALPFILYIFTFIYHLLFKEEKKKFKGTKYFHLKDLKMPKMRKGKK